MKFAPQTAEITGNGYAAESSKDNIVVAQPSARYVDIGFRTTLHD